jgi:hypothetical protein
MAVPQYVPPSYPVLSFVARAGMVVALAAGVLTFVAGVWLAQALQQWLVVPFAAGAALLVAALLASYVEMARIVLDTLVPR